MYGRGWRQGGNSKYFKLNLDFSTVHKYVITHGRSNEAPSPRAAPEDEKLTLKL